MAAQSGGYPAMKRVLPLRLACLALLGAMVVAACNTVEGAGRDLQRGGQAVENAAKRAAR
jgi:entericidin B